MPAPNLLFELFKFPSEEFSRSTFMICSLRKLAMNVYGNSKTGCYMIFIIRGFD